MKKNKLIKSIICTLAVTTLIATTVFAGVAGSSDDPLVTKSYVDDKVTALTNLITNSGSINNGNNTGNNTGTSTGTSVITDEQKKQIIEETTLQVLALSGTTGTYLPVELKNGQILLGSEGTEIILRSGTAVSYVTGSDGVVNATIGSDLKNNISVPKNNIIIVPRSDGRGVRATADSTWLIVKGSYTIN